MSAKTTYWVKWLICVVLAGIFLVIPKNDIYDMNMAMFFAITVFIMAVMAFGFFDMAIPAFVLPIAYILFGVAPVDTVFSPWTSGTTIFMIIGAFVFSNLLGECGLLKRVSYWTILKLGGSFTSMVFAVFIAGVIIALITFNNGYILEVFLAFSICVALDLKKESKAAALICTAGALGAQGIVACTYYPAENGIIVAALADLLPDVSFGLLTRTYYAWPIFFGCLLTLFILTRIYKTKDMKLSNGLDKFRKDYESLGKMTAAEKKAIFFMILLVIYLITCPIHGLSADYAFLVLPWIMVLPGTGIGTVKSVEDVKLGVLFFITGCMSIGTVGVYVGIGDLISANLTPILESLSPLAMGYAFLAVGTLANFALTPFAMLSGLSAPFVQVALDLGMSPMFSLMSLVLSTAAVFMPHEIVCFAVLYSFGYIKMSDFIKMVGLNTIITFILYGVVIYPWWNIIGLI